MFRRTGGAGGALEVLLVHPGGPFFRNKDLGSWTIPKGEAADGEDLLTRASIEFQEELGVPAEGEWIALGSVKQKGGKVVHAWAVEADLAPSFQLQSNEFEMEWPPRSGRRQSFPEVDQALFLSEDAARQKINPAQVEFLDRLVELLQQDRRS